MILQAKDFNSYHKEYRCVYCKKLTPLDETMDCEECNEVVCDACLTPCGGWLMCPICATGDGAKAQAVLVETENRKLERWRDAQ